MSTIDQAFVRAYLEESGPAEPEGSATADAAQPNATADAAEPGGFQPMLQVDGFAWSDRATSLRLAAGIQVDRLADGLASGIAEGRKIVALAGCRPGQGCTTPLLCAAKRLAARGLNVAMVDADFDGPALASQLGLLPEAGLESFLVGRASLEEVAIESIADKMVLLPLTAPSTAQAGSPETEAALSAALDVLRRNYDLVLVDLGAVGSHAEPDGPGERTRRPWVDAVVLVQDVRTTPRAELVGAARRAEAAGLVHLGVVENFV